MVFHFFFSTSCWRCCCQDLIYVCILYSKCSIKQSHIHFVCFAPTKRFISFHKKVERFQKWRHDCNLFQCLGVVLPNIYHSPLTWQQARSVANLSNYFKFSKPVFYWKEAVFRRCVGCPKADCFYGEECWITQDSKTVDDSMKNAINHCDFIISAKWAEWWRWHGRDMDMRWNFKFSRIIASTERAPSCRVPHPTCHQLITPRMEIFRLLKNNIWRNLLISGSKLRAKYETNICSPWPGFVNMGTLVIVPASHTEINRDTTQWLYVGRSTYKAFRAYLHT